MQVFKINFAMKLIKFDFDYIDWSFSFVNFRLQFSQRSSHKLISRNFWQVLRIGLAAAETYGKSYIYIGLKRLGRSRKWLTENNSV